MIPSRGLRWSQQGLHAGRRRIEAVGARSLSTTTRFNALRAPQLLSSTNTLRTGARPQLAKTSLLLQNNGAFRLQSTTSIPTPPPSVASTTITETTPSLTSDSLPSSFSQAADLTSTDLASGATTPYIGYLKDLGLDFGWGPTSCMEWLLEHIHVYAGTPWWATIALTAVAIRAGMFYGYIGAADNAARMAHIKHLTVPIYAKMKEAQARGDTTAVLAVRQELQIIQRRAGVKLSKTFVPLLQVPIGFGSIVLLRAMSKLPVPGFTEGGLLWFSNLTIADPYFVLPAATAGLLHFMIKKGGEMGASPMSPAAMKAFSYGLPALSFLVTLWLPASVQLSFFVAGILSYIQSALFRNPKFRDRIGITALPAPTPAGPTTSGASSGPKLTVLDQNGAPVYSAPRQPTTIIEGFRKEVSTTINDVKESAKKTVEAAKEYTGQSAANGKRSKRELQEADKYEKKRQAEERARLEEVDRRRRAERQAKRARAQQGR